MAQGLVAIFESRLEQVNTSIASVTFVFAPGHEGPPRPVLLEKVEHQIQPSFSLIAKPTCRSSRGTTRHHAIRPLPRATSRHSTGPLLLSTSCKQLITSVLMVVPAIPLGRTTALPPLLPVRPAQ